MVACSAALPRILLALRQPLASTLLLASAMRSASTAKTRRAATGTFSTLGALCSARVDSGRLLAPMGACSGARPNAPKAPPRTALIAPSTRVSLASMALGQRSATRPSGSSTQGHSQASVPRPPPPTDKHARLDRRLTFAASTTAKLARAAAERFTKLTRGAEATSWRGK